MSRIPCRVCGVASEVESRTSDADIYRCPSCRHSFSDLRKNGKVVYDDKYFSEEHRNWFENPNTRLFEQVYRAVRSLGRAASVLDVGCGNGDLLRYLERKPEPFSLTGIDLHQTEPPDGVEFINADFLHTEFDREFDVVVSLATIEHIEDVRAFMRKAAQVCRRNGLVISMTVNESGIIYTLARALRKVGIRGAHERLYSPHHLNHFSVASLRKLHELSGLRVVRTLRHNFPLGAVDLGGYAALSRYVMLVGLSGVFAAGKLTGQTYLQTVVAQR